MRSHLGVLIGTCLAASFVHAESYQRSYSSFLGGTNWEQARDIFTDAAGNTYVVGGTGSSDFPTTTGTVFNGGVNTADGAFGPSDVFVAKFNSSGQRVWATTFGGPNYDRAYAVEVDNAGNVFVGGRAGKGFVTTNGFQTTFSGTNTPSSYGNQNGFVTKLNSSGQIQWSTYVGTGELVRDLAIDNNGGVYVPLVLGETSSRTLGSAFTGKFVGPSGSTAPTTNTRDSGVLKINDTITAGTPAPNVAWARWIGGSDIEATNPSIRVNAAGEVHLLVSTFSTNTSLPSVGTGVQTNNGGGRDQYLIKLNTGGATVAYATYLGGTGGEDHETHSLALDQNGNAVVAIATNSANFPISGGVFSTGTPSTFDIGVAKFDANGVRIASTVIGGNAEENPDGIYVDGNGRIVISATTSSSNFPTTLGAFQTAKNAGEDAAFFVLASDLSKLDYSTFYGGSLDDEGRSLFASADGTIYVTGSTDSSNFPVFNGYDMSYNGFISQNATGGGDAWFAKFVLVPEPASATLLLLGVGGLLRRQRSRNAP